MSRPAAAFALALGAVVLVGGWGFGADALKRVAPHFESMKPNTAVALVLLGAALWFSAGEQNRKASGWASRSLATVAALIGLASLAQYALDRNFGIDELLFSDPQPPGIPGGRMAPATALAFALLGLSLLSLRSSRRVMQLAGDSAALIAGAISQVVLLGYLYGFEGFYRLSATTPVALHTSLAILALAAGSILAREHGLIASHLLARGVAGRITRRLLLATVATLVIIGYLRVLGERWGLYSLEGSVALVVVAAIAVLTIAMFRAGMEIKRFADAAAWERRSAEIATAQYLRLLDNVPGGVFSRRVEKSGQINYTFISPHLAEMLMLSPAEAMADGEAVIERVHPDDRPGFVESILAAHAAGSEWRRDFRVLLPDGSIRWLRAQANPFNLPDGATGWDGTVFDVSEERMLKEQQTAREEQLHRSQRLQAIGQLTGGVAHDFNNLLTVVIGGAEGLAAGLRDNPKLKHLAEMVGAAAQRGAELTSSLLAFARRQPLRPRIVDINELTANLRGLLVRTLGEHIELEFAPAANLGLVNVDPGRFEAAVLNLALNARDAMPKGGKLVIETAEVVLGHGDVPESEEVKPGRYALLSVRDTGIGMTPDVLARALEPFFTTKEFGKGTGLGLSSVYGFAKQSDGHLKLQSEPGQGTVVSLYLPLAEGMEKAKPSVQSLAPRARGETILLVEDDHLVRAHVSDQLQGLGYRVIAVANGSAALAILKKDDLIDLLFTDVVMPGGMNGFDLAREARRIRPELAVLYTTGYTENLLHHRGRLDSGVEVLGKPYHPRELAERVRVVLDQAPAAAGAAP